LAVIMHRIWVDGTTVASGAADTLHPVSEAPAA
jgi:hypothetical protein